jgi:hypothetical protein
MGENCTGGEWSRLRMSCQGKRAEDGRDDLGNHARQTNKRRFQSARLRSRCLSSKSRLSARECLRPGAWHQLEGSTARSGRGTGREISQRLGLSAARLHDCWGRENQPQAAPGEALAPHRRTRVRFPPPPPTDLPPAPDPSHAFGSGAARTARPPDPEPAPARARSRARRGGSESPLPGSLEPRRRRLR